MSAPAWMDKIINDLRKAVEEGVEFVGCRYIDGFEEAPRYCVVGWLAKQAGVDDMTLHKAGKARVTHNDHAAIQSIRESIINHYDGEAPIEALHFLDDLQDCNDGLWVQDRSPSVLLEFAESVAESYT